MIAVSYLDDVHHIGKDFYLLFMENLVDTDTRLAFSISAQMTTTVSISCTACRPSFQVTRMIANGTTVTIPLPTRQSIYGTTYSHRIFNIHADQPVTVRGYTAAPRSTDGYLALPISSFGFRYIVASYPPYQNSEFAIVATKNQTRVNINFPTNVTFGDVTYLPNENYTITLQQLQAYQFQSNQDLTGTIINADQPIGVFSGDKCANVRNGTTACDHLVEQLVPVTSWDTQYVSMYIYGRRNISSLYRVIAGQDNVDVAIIASSKRRMNMNIAKQGNFIEFLGDIDAPVVIRCSQRCAVYQYNQGGSLDNTQYDPFLTTVPGLSQFYRDYLFNGPTMSGTNYIIYVNIIIDSQYLSGLRLDGQPLVPLAQTQIPDTNFTGVIIRTTRSSHSLRHPNPNIYFSAMYYAFSFIESYGMPLGINARHPCVIFMNSLPGNGIDDDCDGRIDEEIANGVDDDGDGRTDEDLATGAPKLMIQTYVDIRSCNPSSINVDPQTIGAPQVMADPKCTAQSPSNVDSITNDPCGRTIQRTWTVTDSCGNNASVVQIIVTGYPGQNYQPPADFNYNCPNDLTPSNTGGTVQVTPKSNCNFAYPSPNITYSDQPVTSYCSPAYRRTWTVAPVGICGNGTQFVQMLRPSNLNVGKSCKNY